MSRRDLGMKLCQFGGNAVVDVLMYRIGGLWANVKERFGDEAVSVW